MPIDHLRAADGSPPIEAAVREPEGSDTSAGEYDGSLRELRRRAAAIARDIWGRGPERCEAHWAGPALLVLVFHGGLTPSEASLKAAGLGSEVVRSRENFRRSIEIRLAEAAAEVTGRGVCGAIGASGLDPDVTIEAFFMAPAAADPASSDSAGALAAANSVAQRDAVDRVSAAAAVTAQARQAVRRAQELQRAGRRPAERDDEPADAGTDDSRNH